MTQCIFTKQPNGIYAYDYTSDGSVKVFQLAFDQEHTQPVVVSAKLDATLAFARVGEANPLGNKQCIFDVDVPAGLLVRISTRTCPTAANYADVVE